MWSDCDCSEAGGGRDSDGGGGGSSVRITSPHSTQHTAITASHSPLCIFMTTWLPLKNTINTSDSKRRKAFKTATCQTKLPKGLQPKEKVLQETNDSESVQGHEPKLVNRFYKRIKRIGVWILSFVSSFLCGAFVAFVLW